MKKILLFLSIFLISKFSFGGWVNLNTGINDNLTGVVFWGNKGLISGHKGLYYTTNGGNGASSWTRFNITNNNNDSLLYNRTKFLHGYSAPTSSYGLNKAVVCGLDTVNNKPVIFLINFNTFSYSIIYSGSVGVNGGLNKITFNQQDNYYYLVGDNGQFVKFDYSGSGLTQIATTFTTNLNAVSFNTTNFCIGTDGNMINGTTNGSIYTFTNVTSPSNNYKDVVCLGLNYSYSVGSDYFKWVFSSFFKNSSYDYGNLNATSLIYYNNCHYVGTDHGIFKSSNTYSFLEWQPSSLNHKINSLWYSGSGSIVYACGGNGVVLTTNDGGGATKPIAKLSLPGGCAGALVTISGITGSSNNCNWYINNSLVFSSCGTSFQYVFAAGQYSVQLNVTNSFGLQDTAFQIITIVDYPKINKPISLNKYILCHQEPLVVTIDSSQQNVYYTLANFGNTNLYGSSGIGNSSLISYTSSPVSESGNYYLQANSTLALCKSNFTDTIKIYVEKTHANFHTATLNAAIGENVINYQSCIDAQNYLWSFSAGSPNISTSSISNPTVSYSSIAQNTIKLICWSNNGCYDSIQKSGPNIFVTPTVLDPCWSLINRAPDAIWVNQPDPDIAQLSASKTGFLACGTYYKEAFASRFGDSLRLSSFGGGYIAKYDFNGVLKWMNYTKQIDYNNSPTTPIRDIIYSVKEDPYGNIFICGKSSNYFFDNRGDSMLLVGHPPLTYNNVYFISKLDSTGRFLWTLSSTMLAPKKLCTDKSGNILAYSEIGGPNVVMELNGVPSYSFVNLPVETNTNLMKIDPSGNVLWFSRISSAPTNAEIETDGLNNVYLTGSFGQSLRIYSAGSLVYDSLYLPYVGNSASNMYLLKYDSLGILRWKVKAYTRGVNSSISVDPLSLTIDEFGNSYVTGANGCGSLQNFFVENSNGTRDSISLGGYYLMKINGNGVCNWINGAKYNFNGWGTSVNKHMDEISVLGFMTNYTTLPLTATFTSQDGINTSLTMGVSDYYIAVYDTLGKMKRIIRSGANLSNPQAASHGLPNSSLFRLHNGDYYIGETLRLYGTGNYTQFDNTIAQTTGHDGAIFKISPLSCAIIVQPGSTVTCVSPTISVNSVSVCPGNTVSLTASGATNYSWSPSIGLSSSTGSIVSVNTNSTTVYSVIGSTGICMTQATGTVYAVTNPSIVVNSASICIGQTAILTASGVNTYTWSTPGSNSPSVIINPLSSTVYTVSGNILGCSDTYTAISTVSVNPSPTVTVNSATVCAGETATLNASGASSYIWASFPTTGPICTFIPLSTKIYTVIGTTMGCSQTVTTSVLVNPNPTITTTSSSSGLGICAGESVTLTATGATSYTWSNGVVNGVGFIPSATNLYTVTGSISSCTAIAFSGVIVNTCAGIEESLNLIQIEVYPNPTQNYLNISGLKIDERISIKLLNVLGQEESTLYYNEKIDLRYLSSGMYFLLIYKNNKLCHQEKIVKE